MAGSLRVALVAGCVLPALACREEVTVPPVPDGVPVVRVLLIDNQNVARITVDGPYVVRSVAAGAETIEVENGDDFGTREIRAADEDVIVANLMRTANMVEIAPKGVPVQVAGRSYRGAVRVTARAGALHVVNAVDLDSYLRSVVGKEMYPSWPAAALQAQAIAARSYAMAKMERTADRDYDVRATTADQAYPGIDSEADGPTAAVEATRGQVLRIHGQLLVAYYHSCCGGHTTDARIGVGDVSSPLQGVPCGACKGAKRYEWTKRFTAQELRDRLNIADLRLIRIQVRSEDGRVRELVLERSIGQHLGMDGTRFRSLTGLSSTLFEKPVVEEGKIVFRGRGFGHGVGLCQWGAKGLAEDGQTTEQILSHYYPDAIIGKAY
jgi:stage II sporulation protein D